MQGRPTPERQMDIFGYHLRYKQKTKKPTGATKGRKESRDIQEKPKQKQECGQTDNNNNTNKIAVKKMRDLDTLIALNCPTLLWPAFPAYCPSHGGVQLVDSITN